MNVLNEIAVNFFQFNFLRSVKCYSCKTYICAETLYKMIEFAACKYTRDLLAFLCYFALISDHAHCGSVYTFDVSWKSNKSNKNIDCEIWPIYVAFQTLLHQYVNLLIECTLDYHCYQGNLFLFPFVFILHIIYKILSLEYIQN